MDTAHTVPHSTSASGAAVGREFLFTTPEQLASRDLRALLQRTSVNLFVIDEAHCISQWGHDSLGGGCPFQAGAAGFVSLPDSREVTDHAGAA